jgi:hypothetical protein
LRQVVEEWTRIGQEAVEPGGGVPTDGQQAAFATFAVANQQGAGGRIRQVARLFAWQVEVGSGVGWDDAAAAELGER